MSLNPERIIPKLAAFSVSFREKWLFPALEECVGRPIQRTPESYRAIIMQPLDSARVFLGVYAFARAGAEQAGYGSIARSILSDGCAYPDSGDFLRAFQNACAAKRIGTNNKLNARLLQACFDMHFRGGSGVGWLAELGQRIAASARVIPVCLDLQRIKGIGPKIAPFLCRDLVWAFGCENQIAIIERIAMQPIDTWLRGIGKVLWPEFAAHKREAVDVLLAAHIVAETDRLGVSAAEFNQGAWYFGTKHVKVARALPRMLEALAK